MSLPVCRFWDFVPELFSEFQTAVLGVLQKIRFDSVESAMIIWSMTSLPMQGWDCIITKTAHIRENRVLSMTDRILL